MLNSLLCYPFFVDISVIKLQKLKQRSQRMGTAIFNLLILTKGLMHNIA